jgi:hypothetical protein
MSLNPGWALAASLLVAIAGSAVLPGRSSASPPLITFDSETCDLGSVVQGEQPECRYSFTNAGSDELKILGVEPSCGCTTALLSAPLLPAGARGGIRVVFDTDNFAGEVVKEIEVHSNDPARRSITLRLKALVEPEIDFEPRVVTFDDVPAGAALKQVVMLTNRRAEPVRVLRLEAQPSSYRCLIPAWRDSSQPLLLEPWDRVAIEVSFTHREALPMAVAGECALEIAGPRKRNFRLKLLALPAP